MIERRTVSLEESASQHFKRILEAPPRQASLGACAPISPPVEIPMEIAGQESPADNVSEAGTYTIDKESPSPEESRARSEIDLVFGVEESSVACDTRTFTRHRPLQEQPHTNGHDDPPVKVCASSSLHIFVLFAILRFINKVYVRK